MLRWIFQKCKHTVRTLVRTLKSVRLFVFWKARSAVQSHFEDHISNRAQQPPQRFFGIRLFDIHLFKISPIIIRLFGFRHLTPKSYNTQLDKALLQGSSNVQQDTTPKSYNYGQKRLPLAAHPESCLDLHKIHFWTNFKNCIWLCPYFGMLGRHIFGRKNWKSAKNCKIYGICNISGKFLEMSQKLGYLENSGALQSPLERSEALWSPLERSGALWSLKTWVN